MNLLAHALLSPDNPGMLVGNLAADWVKGRARLALPTDIQQGMVLHQKIDAFTDAHAAVDACGKLLATRWQRYAPILVDILFDHVLSETWEDYCSIPRQQFIQNTYAALRDHLHLLPPRAQYASQLLLADDWLSCYATLDGIALTFSRVSMRLRQTGHTVELAAAVNDFLHHRAAFGSAFRQFFPELRQHVAYVAPLSVA